MRNQEILATELMIELRRVLLASSNDLIARNEGASLPADPVMPEVSPKAPMQRLRRLEVVEERELENAESNTYQQRNR